MTKPIAVIGSGPSGAVAAHVLIQKGIPVVLLESGTALPSGFLLRANGRTLLRKRPTFHPREAVLAAGRNPETEWWVHLEPGGLSNQWTAAVPRFSREDFTEGERLDPRYVWPLTYEELAPFYTEVEALLGISGGTEDTPTAPRGAYRYSYELPRGWEAVGKAARVRGHALLPVPIANGTPWMLARRGTAFNSFSCLVAPLLRSPHFTLRTGAHVLRLELDATQTRVASVLYHNRHTGQEERIEIGGAVVACGTLNSTKLLFDSACSAFPEGLGNQDGVLGQYLHDHPHEWYALELSKPLPRLAQSAYLTRHPFGGAPLTATGVTLGAASRWDRLLSHTPLPSTTLGVQTMATMTPTTENFATPHPTQKDPNGLPLLKVCLDFDLSVQANLAHSRQNVAELLCAAGIESRCIHEPNIPRPGSAVHYAGTIRMHTERRFGVLDRFNRLHDLPNLLVTDLSCFTTCPEKKPTLTAMALSWRAAAHLADNLKRG